MSSIDMHIISNINAYSLNSIIPTTNRIFTQCLCHKPITGPRMWSGNKLHRQQTEEQCINCHCAYQLIQFSSNDTAALDIDAIIVTTPFDRYIYYYYCFLFCGWFLVLASASNLLAVKYESVLNQLFSNDRNLPKARANNVSSQINDNAIRIKLTFISKREVKKKHRSNWHALHEIAVATQTNYKVIGQQCILVPSYKLW